MNEHLAAQTRLFGIVQKELAKKQEVWTLSKPDWILMKDSLNELRDRVYPAWDVVLAKAKTAATAGGVDPNAIGPVPARGWWDKLHGESVTKS